MRLLWLRSCCAVAEGAGVAHPHDTAVDGMCVAAALCDALHRVAVLGGREGMPRSLGSVYGGSVTRFLGGGLRGVVSRVIHTPGVASSCNGIAVSRDGYTLPLGNARFDPCWHGIHELDVASGCTLRVVGDCGMGPLQFNDPSGLCIASDGFVFVADSFNSRVQVLTPQLQLHCVIGDDACLNGPAGVCVDADVVVVCEYGVKRVSVFDRQSGALLTRFGVHGAGRLDCPCGACFTHSEHHIAVADCGNDCVSVFSVEGAFIRHVGVGVLSGPQGVACSAFDELVIANSANRCVRMFSDVGELLLTFGDGYVTGVAIHGGAVFAHVAAEHDEADTERCVVYA
jgi:DNA-binding beta-propeller fold protein YncE